MVDLVDLVDSDGDEDGGEGMAGEATSGVHSTLLNFLGPRMQNDEAVRTVEAGRWSVWYARNKRGLSVFVVALIMLALPLGCLSQCIICTMSAPCECSVSFNLSHHLGHHLSHILTRHSLLHHPHIHTPAPHPITRPLTSSLSPETYRQVWCGSTPKASCRLLRCEICLKL